MPTASPLLEPLIHTYVPASRTDESLKHDLISHCQEILKRYGGLDVKFRNKIEHNESHIGQKTETNFPQLTDLVKRRRTCHKHKSLDSRNNQYTSSPTIT
jgi:gamma-tubulin complex component 3